jgi:hypothetical protein
MSDADDEEAAKYPRKVETKTRGLAREQETHRLPDVRYIFYWFDSYSREMLM